MYNILNNTCFGNHHRLQGVVYAILNTNLPTEIRQVILDRIARTSQEIIDLEQRDRTGLSDCEEATLWTQHGNLTGEVRDLNILLYWLKLWEYEARRNSRFDHIRQPDFLINEN